MATTDQKYCSCACALQPPAYDVNGELLAVLYRAKNALAVARHLLGKYGDTKSHHWLSHYDADMAAVNEGIANAEAAMKPAEEPEYHLSRKEQGVFRKALRKSVKKIEPACERIEGLDEALANTEIIQDMDDTHILCKTEGDAKVILKAASQHASAAIPEGYVLVPREPTDAMVKAAINYAENISGRYFSPIYKAMIEAVIPEGEK